MLFFIFLMCLDQTDSLRLHITKLRRLKNELIMSLVNYFYLFVFIYLFLLRLLATNK